MKERRMKESNLGMKLTKNREDTRLESNDDSGRV